jgi:hypothetical protein
LITLFPHLHLPRKEVVIIIFEIKKLLIYGPGKAVKLEERDRESHSALED